MDALYHPDFWIATATIGPVLGLANVATMLTMMRDGGADAPRRLRDAFSTVVLATLGAEYALAVGASVYVRVPRSTPWGMTPIETSI